jgi:hypothetical protein
MRTIDPFLMPGLWSGGFQADRSLSMTAGRVASPPKPLAVIESFAGVAESPLRSLDGSSLKAGFHAWFGQSGKRMICSIYPVLEETGDRGLPDFVEAIVLGVRKAQAHPETVAIFSVMPGISVANRVKSAIVAGAQEWHVHLPAPGMREALLLDFVSDRGRVRQSLAATDG